MFSSFPTFSRKMNILRRFFLGRCFSYLIIFHFYPSFLSIFAFFPKLEKNKRFNRRPNRKPDLEPKSRYPYSTDSPNFAPKSTFHSQMYIFCIFIFISLILIILKYWISLIFVKMMQRNKSRQYRKPKRRFNLRPKPAFFFLYLSCSRTQRTRRPWSN